MKRVFCAILLFVFSLVLCACIPAQEQQEATDPSSSGSESTNTSQQESVDPTVSTEPPCEITGYDADSLTWAAAEGTLYFTNPYFCGSFFQGRNVDGCAYWTSDDKQALCIEFSEKEKQGTDTVAGPSLRFIIGVEDYEIIDIERELCNGQIIQMQLEDMILMAKRLITVIQNAEAGITTAVEQATILEIPDGAIVLTEQELAEINDQWFGWIPGETPYPFANSFLTSIYHSPEEISLYEVFYNGYEGDVSAAELDALENICGEIMLDTHRVSRTVMDDVLKTHTGYGLDAIQQTGIDAFIYLEEYDAYYIIRGDTNWFYHTMLEGYRTEDGQLVLVYEDNRHTYATGSQYTVVTLQSVENEKSFNGYWFVSNLPYGK